MGYYFANAKRDSVDLRDAVPDQARKGNRGDATPAKGVRQGQIAGPTYGTTCVVDRRDAVPDQARKGNRGDATPAKGVSQGKLAGPTYGTTCVAKQCPPAPGG